MSLEKYTFQNTSQEKNEKIDNLIKEFISDIPIKFESPDELRELQNKLQERFLQLNKEEQKIIMDQLGKTLGNLWQKKEQNKESEEIANNIKKVRFLLQTFHLVFRTAEK